MNSTGTKTLQEVYRKFDGLVESHSGDDLADYNTPHRLRLGVLICSLLQAAKLVYNLTMCHQLQYGVLLPSEINFCYSLPKFELLKVA